MQNDILYAFQQMRETLPGFVTLFLGGLSNFVGGIGAIALVLVIYWCVDKRKGTFLMLAVLLAMFIGQTIKNVACVYRPWVFDARLYVAEIAREGASGYSMPSVHTAVAVGVVFAVALYAGALPALALVLDSHWYYFAKYFILLVMLVVVYPACFVRFDALLPSKNAS